MAGIFGFFDKTISTDLIVSKFYSHAKQNFEHFSNFEIFHNGIAGLGCATPFSNKSLPIKSKNKNYIFQHFGEIYLPNGSLLNFTNFEKQFLNPYIANPKDFLHTLDGSFIFALYDTKNKTFTLCNDPFGNFALYYYLKDNSLIFSTQLHSITEIIKKNDFDQLGIYEYLGVGFPLNGKTYYQDIKKLQAGELLYFSPKKNTLTKYYKLLYKSNSNKKENFQIIKESFISSIKNRTNNYESIGAAISGGYDSRITWGILIFLNKKNDVTAFTHGLNNSRDMQIAKKIATKLELDHKTKPFDLDFIKSLPNLWEVFSKLTEGLIPINGAHALKSWEFGQKHYKVILDSHGGALFRRQFMKVAEKRIKSTSQFSSQFFNLIKSPLLSFGILKPEIKDLAINASKIGLKEYFNLTNKADLNGNKIDMFYLEQISGNKYSSASNAQMNWLMLAHPFLNIGALNALQKISIKDRSNQNIYKHIVNETSPIMKKFYLENMGMPAPYHGFTYLRYGPMIYEILLNKSIGKVSMNYYKKLSLRRFVTDYDLFFRINFDNIKEILLRPNNKFNDFVNRAHLENLINYVEKNDSYKLSSWADLITLKLFFDVFH